MADSSSGTTGGSSSTNVVVCVDEASSDVASLSASSSANPTQLESKNPQQHTAANDTVSVGEKSASYRSTGTATSSVSSSSSTATSSFSLPPPHSSSSSSFTRRRRQPDHVVTSSNTSRSTSILSSSQQQQRQGSGSPFFALKELKPQTVSTAAVNETESCCSEDEEYQQQPLFTENLHYAAAADELLMRHGLDAPSLLEDDDLLLTTTTMDLEMGYINSTTATSAANNNSYCVPLSPLQQQQPKRSVMMNHRQRFNTSPPSSSISSSISTTSSFRSRRSSSIRPSPPRHNNRLSPTSNNSFTTTSTTATVKNHASVTTASNNGQPSSLRASLDAGMAAVRNWIRARGGGGGNGNPNYTGMTQSHHPQHQHHDFLDQGDVLRPRSRSVTWQTAPHNSMSSVASQISEELDDLLQLDDLSTYTNNSSRTEDDNSVRSSTGGHRPASAPTVPRGGGGGGGTAGSGGHHYRIKPTRNTNSATTTPPTWSVQHDFFHSHPPDTILEELDEGGAVAADTLDLLFSSRKRSQSEPDGRRIPDFFLGPSRAARYNTSSSFTSPRQRRGRTLRNNAPSPSHPLENITTTSSSVLRHSATSPPPHPTGRRINPRPRRPRVLTLDSSETGASLSSSAAAALYDNPTTNHDTFSDAGASVATTATVPASTSAFEQLTVVTTTTPVLQYDPVAGISPMTVNTPSSEVRNNVNDNTAAGGPTLSPANTNNSNADPVSPAAMTNSTLNTPVASTTGPAAAVREGSVRSQQSQVDETERQARMRWIRINRRFQFVITVVALLFSLLLFAILICWVVLTSAYVLSFEKSCDVPLKRYFWLVTLQLVLDVFRSDIMRFVFQWDANSNNRIPPRVIAYNITYLVYALLVMRLGVRSVFIDQNTCNKTASELYNASTAFVSLSLAAWTTIICGYLLPFCVVAAMLTCNGYNPTSHTQRTADENMTNRGVGVTGPGGAQPVFPAAYATTGAPPGTVDQLAVVHTLENVPENSRECCICMEEFTAQELLVETPCKHIFHKQCCREWLRQARTCPVCRADIPGALQAASQEVSDASSRIPLGPTGRPVVGLVRILRRTTGAIARTMSTSSPSHAVHSSSNNNTTANGARTGS